MLFSEAEQNLIIDNCYKIGQIVKPHAQKGQLNAKIFVDLEEINQESVLVEIDKYLVPFFIDYKLCNFDAQSPIIKFNGIDKIEQAKKFGRNNLFLPKHFIPNPDDLIIDWENFVIGFTLTDEKTKKTGKIIDFIDENKNPLFILDHNGNTVLIPVNSIEIIDANYDSKSIVAIIPDSLFSFID